MRTFHLALVAQVAFVAAQTTSPEPCSCGWILDYACPNFDEPGVRGYATDDGSACFAYCCPKSPSAPPSPRPPPPPPSVPPSPLSPFPPPSSPFSCGCGWTAQYACPNSGTRGWMGFAQDDGSQCFTYCCPPSPSTPPRAPPPPLPPGNPPLPPSPPLPPAAPPPPACSSCDAGAECGYCLQLVPDCPFWPALVKPTCGPNSTPGEWCAGDNSCGTGDPSNSCFFWDEIYVRVECVLTPPSPPPPKPPFPPANPGESAYLPAPPPPADLSGLDQLQETPDDGLLGPLNLPWLVVIVVLIVCVPCLIIVCFWYLCVGRCVCRKDPDGKQAPPHEPEPNSLGYGGTLVVDDGDAAATANDTTRSIDRL